MSVHIAILSLDQFAATIRNPLNCLTYCFDIEIEIEIATASARYSSFVDSLFLRFFDHRSDHVSCLETLDSLFFLCLCSWEPKSVYFIY